MRKTDGAEYGDERDPEMMKVFERINPSGNAHKIRSALLVAHGRNDPRVPFSEAEQIAPLVRKIFSRPAHDPCYASPAPAVSPPVA